MEIYIVILFQIGFLTHAFNGFEKKYIEKYGFDYIDKIDSKEREDVEILKTSVNMLGSTLGVNEYLLDQTAYMDKNERSNPVYVSAPGYLTIQYAMKQSPEKFFNGPAKKLQGTMIVGEKKEDFIERFLISKFKEKGLSPYLKDINIAINNLCTKKPCIAFFDISKLKKIPVSPVAFNRNGTNSLEEYIKQIDIDYINDFFSSSIFQESKHSVKKQIAFSDLATLARFIPNDAIQIISIPDIFELKQRLAQKKGFEVGDKVDYEKLDLIEKNNFCRRNR